MSSESSELREFAMRKFGSLAGLARKLEITPQSLNPYFQGRKQVGGSLAKRLADLGFEARAYGGLRSLVDFEEVEIALGRPVERFASTLQIPVEQILSWKQGESLQVDQLVRLINLVASVAASRIEGLAPTGSGSAPASSLDQAAEVTTMTGTSGP